MPRTFQLSSTDSAVSGQKKLLIGGDGVAGSITLTANSGGGTASQGFVTDTGSPNYSGATPTGTWSVEVNITTGDSSCNIRAELWRATNGGGAGSTGPVAAANQVATAGLKTFTFNNPALGTWDPVDNRFQLFIIVTNTASHGGSRSVTFDLDTTNAEVVTQFPTLTTVSGSFTANAIFKKTVHVTGPTITESFTGADGSQLHGTQTDTGSRTWSVFSPTNQSLITNNRLEVTSTTQTVGISSVPVDDTQTGDVQATFHIGDTADFGIGLFLRAPGETSRTGAVSITIDRRESISTNRIQITGTSTTTIPSSFARNTTYVLRAESRGTTIRVFLDGVLVGTHTGETRTGINWGIDPFFGSGTENVGTYVDDWSWNPPKTIFTADAVLEGAAAVQGSFTANAIIKRQVGVHLEDRFSRTVSDAVGQPDVGERWTVQGGSDADWDVDGSRAVITKNATDHFILQAGANAQDLMFYAKWQTSALPPDPGDGQFLLFNCRRLTTGPDKMYRIAFRIWQDQPSIQLTATRFDIGSNEVELGNVLSGVVATTGVLHVRGRIWNSAGTVRIRSKIWIDGNPEPDWQYDVTDSTPNPEHEEGGPFQVQTFSSDVVTHYLDDIEVYNLGQTLALDAILKKEATSSFTADAIIRTTVADDFTADAFLLAVVADDFTADAIVFATTAGSLTADAELLNRVTDDFTADAIVFATQTASFTTDAILFATTTASVTADAIITATISGSFLADAITRTTTADDFTADAIVFASTSDTISADALIELIATGSFAADAFIQPYLTAEAWLAGRIDADAIVLKTAEASISGAAWILGGNVAAFTADAVIFATIEDSFSADSVLHRTTSATFAADAVQLKTTPQALTADAIILAGRTDGFASDAVLLSPSTGSFVADSIVFGTVEQSLTGDAAIHAVQSGSLIADAVFRAIIPASLEADAVLLGSVAGSFTADATLADQLAGTGSFTTDAILKATVGDDLTADAVVQVVVDGELDADACLLAVQEASFAADAVITGTIASSFTADSIHLSTFVHTFSTDAYVSTVENGAVTADAVIHAVQLSNFDANAVVRDIVADTFDADAVIHKSQTASFTADAEIFGAGLGSFTADAVLFGANQQTFSADAVITIVRAYRLATTMSARTLATSLTARTLGTTMSTRSLGATLLLRRTDSFTASAVIE